MARGCHKIPQYFNHVCLSLALGNTVPEELPMPTTGNEEEWSTGPVMHSLGSQPLISSQRHNQNLQWKPLHQPDSQKSPLALKNTPKMAIPGSWKLTTAVAKNESSSTGNPQNWQLENSNRLPWATFNHDPSRAVEPERMHHPFSKQTPSEVSVLAFSTVAHRSLQHAMVKKESLKLSTMPFKKNTFSTYFRYTAHEQMYSSLYANTHWFPRHLGPNCGLIGTLCNCWL